MPSTRSSTAAVNKFAFTSASRAGEKFFKIHPNLTERTHKMLTVEGARTRRPMTWLVMEIMDQWAGEYEKRLVEELEQERAAGQAGGKK